MAGASVSINTSQQGRPACGSSKNSRSREASFLIKSSFPCGSAGKESACSVGDLGLIPGLGKSPGEGKGYPLQYSGLENSMNCIFHGGAKSWTRLSKFHFHGTFNKYITLGKRTNVGLLTMCINCYQLQIKLQICSTLDRHTFIAMWMFRVKFRSLNASEEHARTWQYGRVSPWPQFLTLDSSCTITTLCPCVWMLQLRWPSSAHTANSPALPKATSEGVCFAQLYSWHQLHSFDFKCLGK